MALPLHRPQQIPRLLQIHILRHRRRPVSFSQLQLDQRTLVIHTLAGCYVEQTSLHRMLELVFVEPHGLALDRLPQVEEQVTADPVERQRIYDEAQEIVYEEAPAVFLLLPEEIEAASARLKDWMPSADSRINLHDVCVLP